jgi:glycosyltransferase involved in cell wall biosynthesis
MRISVIIPSYARPRDLERCLDAVALQSRKAQEVLIIARDGDQQTWDVASIYRDRLRSLKIVAVTQPGLIAALNQGLESATGDILVFTDDDAEAQTDWLERIECSFSNPRIGAVGGRDWLQLPGEPAIFRPSQVKHVGVISWYGKQYGNHHCPLRGHARKVMFLKGVNMAFRRSAVGAYRIDNRLRGSGAQVGSELDLCLHLRRLGFTVIFDDRILVKHHCGARPKDDLRNDVNGSVVPDICYNTHYLIAKHLGLHRSLAYLGYGRLLGSRLFLGLIAAVKWSLKGDPFVWNRLLQMTRIAAEAFRTGRRNRAVALRRSTELQPLGQQSTAA